MEKDKPVEIDTLKTEIDYAVDLAEAFCIAAGTKLSYYEKYTRDKIMVVCYSALQGAIVRSRTPETREAGE